MYKAYTTQKFAIEAFALCGVFGENVYRQADLLITYLNTYTESSYGLETFAMGFKKPVTTNRVRAV